MTMVRSEARRAARSESPSSSSSAGRSAEIWASVATSIGADCRSSSRASSRAVCAGAEDEAPPRPRPSSAAEPGCSAAAYSKVCSPSSREGTMTITCRGVSRRRPASSGSMYASVLPLPVCEWIASDSPAKTRRIAAVWIGSGAAAPSARTRASSDAGSGSPANVDDDVEQCRANSRIIETTSGPP